MGSGDAAAPVFHVVGREVRLVLGDITTVPADAIVNAANSALAGGGGVDGAIHRAGGPGIMADLRRRYGEQRHCPTGSAVVSTAGRLPARWVIHAVGPVWRDGRHDEPALLASAFTTALEFADQEGAASVTLPAISCGAYGCPLDRGASIAVDSVAAYLPRAGSLRLATFVLASPSAFEAFRAALLALA